jgi:vacuolar-type H+-ATPase subunit H
LGRSGRSQFDSETRKEAQTAMHTLIDELENLLNSAMRMPVGGKLLIDETALRRLVEEMRASLPDELRMGQRIAGERDRILADARAQARRIIEDAQAQVNARLDEQGVVQAARQRAREIQAEAEKTATNLRGETDQYVLNQFSALESRLIRVLREVQAGQRTLTHEPGDKPGSA